MPIESRFNIAQNCLAARGGIRTSRRRFALLDPTRSAMVEPHERNGSRHDMARVALRSSRSFSYPALSESSARAFARRVGEADPTGAPKPRLLDRVRAAIRARHYSRRTEKAYVAWIRRYIFFHDKRHPADMGAAISRPAPAGSSCRPHSAESTRTRAGSG